MVSTEQNNELVPVNMTSASNTMAAKLQSIDFEPESGTQR